MQIRGNEITVHRGETFSIEYILQNKDGSPYVFTNQAHNPHLLFTVASSKYSQAGRYVKHWWLEIPNEMQFYKTQPVKIPSFNNEPNVDMGDYIADVSTYALYYVNVNGVKTYKRWTGEEFVDYECRIVKTFNQSDTNQWVGQSYVYDVNYVDGDSTLEYLQTLYTMHNLPSPMPSSVEDLYDALIEIDANYSNIDINKKLHTIAISLPIITPSKLSVIGYIDGGIR